MTISKKGTAALSSETAHESMSLSELSLLLLTLMIWSHRILLQYVESAIMRIPIIGPITEQITIIAYFILIVFSLPKIFSKIKAIDFLFWIFVAAVYLLNFIVFPANDSYLQEHLVSFLFFVFPLYYIGLSMNYERIYPWLYRISAITIIVFTFSKLFISAPMDEVESVYQGDMWGAYNVLPHVCVIAIGMLKKATIVNVTLSSMGIILITFLGSRGPLICVSLAVLVYLVLFKSFKRPVLSWGLIIATFLLVAINLENIILFLYDLADNAGLSVRVFEKFLEGSLSNPSSRNVLADKLSQMIAEKPFLGNGLFSDRVAIDTYAHNIAIELWLDFGIVLGTAILGGMLFILAKTSLLLKKHRDYALLFIPLLFSGFIKLFLSNSYLEEMYLFLLLGVAVNFARAHK